MAPNLRPRVEEFDPFRAIRPSSAGASLDTYVQPTVDQSAARETLTVLDAVRDLSPSVGKFLDRAYAHDQEQVRLAAESAVSEMTPEQIRQESEQQWEAISQERGIDNPWWKIRLDEAAGRRLGLEFAERLTARGLEASNPDDPNAHLRVLEEERARQTAGMNDFQRFAFDDVAASASEKFVLTAATNREQRVQAKFQQQFRDDVRGLVRESLDPALGGAVDIASLRTVIEAERARSGNDGRSELFAALDAAIGIEAQKADSEAELDALRVQAASLLDEISAQTFGGDVPLEDAEGLRLDALDVRLEAALREREDFLDALDDRSRTLASRELGDFTLGLASRVFSEDLDPGAAEAEMVTKAREIAERAGADADYLIGVGRVALLENATKVESTRFAGVDDPDTVRALERLVASEDFDSGWYGVALAGAVNDRKITRGTYAELLEAGSDGVTREVRRAAASAVDPLTKSIGERVLSQASGLLESIPDEATRDDVEARLLAAVDAAMTSERGRLGGLIESKGLEEATAAIDEWTPDFLNRSGKIIQDILADVSESVPGGALDKPRAFRDRLQRDPIYQRARERWIYEFVRTRLDDDSASAIGAPGQSDYLPNPNDVAAYVATGRANATSGLALRLYDQAEEAFLHHLEQQSEIGKPEVQVRDALRRADDLLRLGSFEVPAPEVTDDQRRAAAEQARAQVEGQAAAATGAEPTSRISAADVADAQARVERFRAEGRSPEWIAEAERMEASALASFREQRQRDYAEHQSVLARMAMGEVGAPISEARRKSMKELGLLRDPMASPYAAGPGYDVIDGRVVLTAPARQRKAWYSATPVLDVTKTEQLQRSIEGQFVAAKLWTGLTLDEVRAGKGQPWKDAPPEKWINLDRQAINPTSVPFFGSIAELEAADDAMIGAWLKEFPGYSREMFLAAQRLVILERIPEPKKEEEK